MRVQVIKSVPKGAQSLRPDRIRFREPLYPESCAICTRSTTIVVEVQNISARKIVCTVAAEINEGKWIWNESGKFRVTLQQSGKVILQFDAHGGPRVDGPWLDWELEFDFDVAEGWYPGEAHAIVHVSIV
jgi:hypothetical protein